MKKILLNLDLIFAGFILVALIAVATATVVSRYILGSPFMWSEEIQVICFTWISFLGAGAAFRFGAHVSIEMLIDLIPLRYRRFIELILGILVSALLCYVFCLSVIYVQQSMMLGKTTTILKIPDYLINIALPVGLVFMIAGNTSAVLSKFYLSCKEIAQKV